MVFVCVRAPSGNRPALRAGHRNSLARQRRAAASSDGLLLVCERGASPPFTRSPRSRGQRTEFAAISLYLLGVRAVPGNAPCRSSRRRGGKGAPTFSRHRPSQAGETRDSAGLDLTSLFSWRAVASSDGSLLIAESGAPGVRVTPNPGAPAPASARGFYRAPENERGSAPFHTFPPVTRAANRVRCRQSLPARGPRRPGKCALPFIPTARWEGSADLRSASPVAGGRDARFRGPGSHIAVQLARGGEFRWVVVDREGGSAPFTHSPRSGGQRTMFAAVSLSPRSGSAPLISECRAVLLSEAPDRMAPETPGAEADAPHYHGAPASSAGVNGCVGRPAQRSIHRRNRAHGGARAALTCRQR